MRRSYWFPPLPLIPRLGTRCAHAPSTHFFFFFFLSSAGMEASWRQVAGGRGRARGRATAAPSSGDGIHLRGAGGGREKDSAGAAGPGPSPRGAATPAAAGSSARRSPAGSEALQTSVACGEKGSRPRCHLLRHLLVRTASPPLLSFTFPWRVYYCPHFSNLQGSYSFRRSRQIPSITLSP